MVGFVITRDYKMQKTTKPYKKPPLTREVAVRRTDGGVLKAIKEPPVAIS